MISIHALREEGDLGRMKEIIEGRISIHALREEGDRCRSCRVRSNMSFLSTPSARRATRQPVRNIGSAAISIHALREEGDRCIVGLKLVTSGYFYPRPPRGGRLFVLRDKAKFQKFLSTPSARRATFFFLLLLLLVLISIHALREEGDKMINDNEEV